MSESLFVSIPLCGCLFNMWLYLRLQLENCIGLKLVHLLEYMLQDRDQCNRNAYLS